jgi:crotonobetainyl-CoA:carnitine CoA-transferase CaiB-like acyl-CoA transferase
MHAKGPLNGIRVLDFGTFIAGPYAACLMAMLGAEVVKVEPPDGGDGFRRGEGSASPYFNHANAGKKSLAVNLKSPEGLALVKALLPKFDVLVENSRPGKMAALGLGADQVRAINPSMIYSAVSGFGDGGPWRDRAAYDTIGLTTSGFLSLMSDKDNVKLAGTCIADLTAGLVNTIGIVSALVGRGMDANHKGAEIQTSLLEAMTTMTIDAITQMFSTGEHPHRESRHPYAQSFCLTARDGLALTVHMSSPQKFWERFAAAFDRSDLCADPRFLTYDDRRKNYFELRPIVEKEFLRHDRAEWARRLTEADVPWAPVVAIHELPSNEQMQWLDMFEPEHNGQHLVRPPWRINGARATRPNLAPEIGEHSRALALEVLPAAEVDRLIASGVLVQT